MDDQEAARPPVATTPEPEEAPERSALSRLFGIFVDPRGVFASMRVRPRFLLAFLVVLSVQPVFGWLMFQSGLERDRSIEMLQEQGKDPRQIEAMERFYDSPAAPVVHLVSPVVMYGFGIIASASLLFFMGNLMLGARLTFPHYVSIAAYSAVVSLVNEAARIGVTLARDDLDARLGLGNLLGERMGYFGTALDLATDPLFIWSTAVAAIGVSVYARKGFRFGAMAVLPGYVLSILFRAALLQSIQ